ncbi:MAG: hypothetical protein ACREQA_09095 [Candidatus Binatia bacterium]
MAIIRNPLQCLSCGAKVITRTAPGIFPPQEHTFPCPGCGVEIRFTLDRDKKKVGYSFGRPVNAKWVRSEKGAIETLSFDPDRVAPKDMTNVFSPFLAEAFELSLQAHQAYAREEGIRRGWRNSQWPWIQKLIVHFDNRNLKLFDKEAKLGRGSQHTASWARRLALLYNLFEGAFDSFTLSRLPEMRRVRQRIALGEAVSPDLYDRLVKLYVASSRMVKTWQELNKIRTAFLANYLTISPVLRTQYWTKRPTDLSEYVVPEKNFDQLRQLYVDCFETLCRLTVIAIGHETIIHHKSLDIPKSKGQMTLWEYEAMPNGNKHTILEKYPIQDLFVPVIDHKLRNGIGHHSAVYAAQTDEVIYYEQEGEALQETRMSYTEFVFKVLQIYSAVELAALYFHPLHVKACEAE